MIKKARIMIVIAFITSWCSMPSFAIELLTAAQNSAPKYYKTGNHQMTGLCVDIIKAIEHMDPGIKFKGYQNFIPFKRLQHLLELGQLDIFLGFKKTEARRHKYVYIDIPLYQLNYVMVARIEDTIEIQSFDDVRALQENGKIITVFGSAASRFLKKQGGLFVIDGAKSPFILLKMLKNKRGRFAFYHDLGLQSMINREQDANEFKVFPVSFLSYSHYAALSKNVPGETIKKVKNALKKLNDNGTLKTIHQKYHVLKPGV